MAPRWLPLESNPEFLLTLGVDANWQFFDVFGLDPELLAMIPTPCCALVLLFPITDTYEKFRADEDEAIKSSGQEVSPNVYFTKQTVGNACGTIGIIHSIANNQCVTLKNGFLKNFLEATKDLSPDERAKALETDEGISTAHEESAKEGQTEAPSPETKVNLHFVAFVHKDGSLYELDGRKNFPINHGKTSEQDFLKDAASVCKKFMQRDASNHQFNIVALSSAA
eukprot:gene297-9949_t